MHPERRISGPEVPGVAEAAKVPGVAEAAKAGEAPRPIMLAAIGAMARMIARLMRLLADRRVIDTPPVVTRRK